MQYAACLQSESTRFSWREVRGPKPDLVLEAFVLHLLTKGLTKGF